MTRNQRVTMRHPELSKKRKTDVTAEVREDQMAIHQKSGWQVVKPTADKTSTASKEA